MQALTKTEPSTLPSVVDNEDLIIRSFREGDKESFRCIYDRVVGPLTYFVENIIFSRADAEDIVADAFYKLFHARDGMKSFEHIKRWLYVVARNAAIDHCRLRTKRRESHTEVAYLESDADGAAQLETERIKNTVFQSILAEIERLPLRRRAILRLYFFEQKSTAEIAEQLGLNSQTVLNHKSKALESLRNTGKFKWLRPLFIH